MSDPKDKFSTWLLTLWPATVIAPLIWAPLPSILVGHPWKAELAISISLAIPLLPPSAGRDLFNEGIRLRSVVIPALLFIAWSGLSASWATSAYSVAHHTLIWAVYLIFFLLLSAAFRSEAIKDMHSTALAIVLAIVTSVCLTEYFLRPAIDETFGFRYERYGEVLAALLPLTAASAMVSSARRRLSAIGLFVLLAAGVIASQSRGAALASLLGTIIFALAALVVTRRKRALLAVFAVAAVVAIAGGMQVLSLISDDASAPNALNRFHTSVEEDQSNSFSRNIRIMFYHLGTAMVRDHPITGIGADNFWLRANEYRALISTRPENRQIVQGNEGAIPERAHNEYLQVATELGIPGLVIFAGLLGVFLFLGGRAIWKDRDLPRVFIRLAAFAGICVFLLSSVYSSFSFRLVQNGIIFFFLAAVLLRNTEESEPVANTRPVALARPLALAAVLALLTLSGLKAMSQYLTYRAERETTITDVSSDLLLAKRLDPDNFAADAIYGMALFNTGYYDSAAGYLETAVVHGIGPSPVYSYLISARYLANDVNGALKDAEIGVKLFPYSVFMRTRYGVLLEKAGYSDRAAEQFRIADEIDPRQAASWRSLITQGPGPTADGGRNGVGVPNISDMQPQAGVYAIIAERNILHPEEKSEFFGASSK